jgi:hypothetical protein
VLGWQVVQESKLEHPDGRNCMGIPLGLARDVTADVGIYHPLGRMEGSVEIISFSFDGIDFADAPVGRGWAALRFAVTDLENMVERAKAGACLVSNILEYNWQPHGLFRAVSVQTTWGARLEMLERV